MSGSRLFYEDEFEALQLTISDSERQFKECAAHLFPHMKPESGYAKLKACINSERDERLTFGQIVALSKFCDRYYVLEYFCDETLHARPDRKAPADEEVRLVAAVKDAAQQLERATKLLDRMQGGRIGRAA